MTKEREPIESSFLPLDVPVKGFERRLLVLRIDVRASAFPADFERRPPKEGAQKGFHSLEKIGIVGSNIGYAVFS